MLFRNLLAVLIGLLGAPAIAAGDCAAGKTVNDGVLTVATGNPAYFPWVIDDAPEKGKGFEAAVAYAVALKMGYPPNKVNWVRTSFDESIQPGAKNFDFNLQQFSITEDREKVVDFSDPYYTTAMAVLIREPTLAAGARPNLESLKSLKWGAVATTTALPVLMETIAPDSDPLLYNDNPDVIEAMKSNQIDAALFDLPTALYLSAVVLEDGLILGQFPPERSQSPDHFGLLMEEGNPLKDCVNGALSQIRDDGTLAEIEDLWLAQTTNVPVIE